MRRTPVQSAGNHEMDDEPEFFVRSGPGSAFDADGDALADAAQLADCAAFNGVIGGSTVRRTKTLCSRTRSSVWPTNARLERGDVGGDVGQFGH